jgi:hypothetical protein
MAMRHEAVLTKETRKVVYATQTHNAGNASTPSLTRRFGGKKTNGIAAIMLQPPFLATIQAEVEKTTEPD